MTGGPGPAEEGPPPRGVGSGPAASEAWRVAYHEAGHVVAAHLLRGKIGPASIEPTRKWRGVAYVRARAAPDGDLGTVEVSLVTMPARVRRYLEAETVVLLAGAAAERYAPRDVEPSPAPSARPRLGLTRGDAKLLAAGNGDGEPPLGDMQRALRVAARLRSPGAPKLLTSYVVARVESRASGGEDPRARHIRARGHSSAHGDALEMGSQSCTAAFAWT